MLTGAPPLSWTQRVQISLDAARGLEYIHEHTKPTYIHRDIKSANILIDNDCRAKVGPGLLLRRATYFQIHTTSTVNRVVFTIAGCRLWFGEAGKGRKRYWYRRHVWLHVTGVCHFFPII